MALAPTVLYPLTLPALLSYVLRSRPGSAPTTLIVCSSRESFLQALSRSLPREGGRDAESLQQLMPPTLCNLATARHVNIAFCASVPALLAHLSAYCGFTPKPGTSRGTTKETVVLVNPLSLHAPTPSFSAQGLSRTFAAAVETAIRVDAKLVLVEGVRLHRPGGHHDEEEGTDGGAGAAEDSADEFDSADPWEQEVPILNVSARRFIPGGGERSWAGRTVKVSRIAGRWFRFRKVGSDHG